MNAVPIDLGADRVDPHRLADWKVLLGELINSGARLRFFPHRAMMFLALAELAEDRADRAGFIASASETIAEFRRIADGMAVDHRGFGVADDLSPWLSAMMQVDRAGYDHVVTTFAEGSLGILAALKRGNVDVRPDTIRLARFVATTLLDRMNRLVADFAAELSGVAKREEAQAEAVSAERRGTATSQASVIGLTDELARVNATVHIISLNASIQAAQAGETGRSFGVIASEIQKLSGEIRALTLDIRGALRAG